MFVYIYITAKRNDIQLPNNIKLFFFNQSFNIYLKVKIFFFMVGTSEQIRILKT